MPFDGTPEREPHPNEVFRKRREAAIALWREHGGQAIDMTSYECCALGLLARHRLDEWSFDVWGCPVRNGLEIFPAFSAAAYFGIQLVFSAQLFATSEPPERSPDELGAILLALPYPQPLSIVLRTVAVKYGLLPLT